MPSPVSIVLVSILASDVLWMYLRIAAERRAAPDRGRHRWFRAASGR
jgi:hypothetical protein